MVEVGLLATFEKKRVGKIKRHFNDSSEDCRLSDQDVFRINVFNVTIETVTSQLYHRFVATRK
jgi:hypothetical protein